MSNLDDRLLGEQIRRATRELNDAPAHWNYAEPSVAVQEALDRLRLMPAPPSPSFPTRWGESAHGWSEPLCSCDTTGYRRCQVTSHRENGYREARRLGRRARVHAQRMFVAGGALGAAVGVVIALVGRAGGGL